MNRKQVYTAIDTERDHQIDKWGGSEHDKGHSVDDWVAIFAVHLNRFSKASCYDATRDVTTSDVGEAKRQLIKLGAIAVAALESWKASDDD